MKLRVEINKTETKEKYCKESIEQRFCSLRKSVRITNS